MMQDPSRYKSPDEQVRAVATAAAKALTGTDEVAKGVWRHLPMEGEMFEMTPAEAAEVDSQDSHCDECRKTQIHDGVKLRTCKDCGVMKYCSVECQRKGWKMHKLLCKGLKEIAEQGDQAASLPIGPFEEEARVINPLLRTRKVSSEKISLEN